MSLKKICLVGAMLMPSMAAAEMPVFSAKCLENFIDSDLNGTVRINGAPMDVTEFNPNYYQAVMESLTISISHEGGGRDLIVNFTGSGGANGPCEVLSVAEGEAAGADDGGGAMSGSSGSGEERVHFSSGASSAVLSGGLNPGDAMRYILGAKANQFLDVYLDFQGDGLVTYRIFNPDGSLLVLIEDGATYEGQLWQSGDHVIEVIGRGSAPVSYTLNVGIN